MAANKLHHAYLFEGPAGVGKRTTAQALAMALLCADDAQGCGQCRNCRRVHTGNHPDFRALAPLEGKSVISIEQIRDAERWFVLPPHESARKLLLIAPADAMTEPAANALLKTLEEPRRGHYIILSTAMSQGLLPTVRSRCQRIRFGVLANDTVVDLLQQGGLDAAEARWLAELAGGSMVKAAQYRDADLAPRLAFVSAILDGATRRTPETALMAIESLRGDREGVQAGLELLIQLLAEWLWQRAAGDTDAAKQPLTQRLDAPLQQMATSGTVRAVAQYIAAAHHAMTAIKRNNMNPQLAVEAMLMAMRGRSTDARWVRTGAR
jgi:DNA polymerase-3 subunit delta'